MNGAAEEGGPEAAPASGGPDGRSPDGAEGAEEAGARPAAKGMSAKELEKTLERLDALIAATRDLERLRMGMGIRLALGMAQEMRLGEPLGSRTGDLVALWGEEHGQEFLDLAVRVAREFLTKPDELRRTLADRLASLGIRAEGGAG